jgi:nifR3 family TIM-barrel protein
VRATTEEHDAFSVQLYGVDPATVGRAVELLVDECVAGTRPAHIDLNFGCPVPKVTRKGGGAALPWRRRLFGDVVSAAVRAAGDVPVTVKTRVGIDPQHHTYLEAGAIAQGAGAAAITLHGRTADQLYSGTADWTHIARLVEAVDIPVLGNGDVWEADDALRMVAETGCAGVVVGRGCLGRPWLFGDLAAAFAGSTQRALPTFREVAAVMHRHATLLAAEHGETHGCSDFRKHVAWYTKGFSVGSDTRRALAMVSSLDELAELLAGVEDQPYPVAVLGAPRGRTTPPRPVALPAGWLDDRDDPRPPVGAELLVGGG